jgi:Flp pilus assembly protein TadG
MKLSRRRSAVERVARFGRSTEGATAVEFALVAAPFFFLLGSIMEIGVMLFTEYRMQSAVDAAARLVRTGNASVSTPEQFADAICQNASGIPDCANRIGFVVTSGPRFADITMPDMATIGPGTRSFAPGGPEQPVAVVATVDWTFILPSMRLMSNIENSNARRLQGIAVFQREPFDP